MEVQVHDRVRGEKVSQQVSLVAEHSQEIASETCLLESKERGYISQIGRILDATTGKNDVKKKKMMAEIMP